MSEARSYNKYFSTPVKGVRKPLWHHEHGLSYTASGYGSRLPTEWMIRHEKKLYRIYCVIYSNAGSIYVVIGKTRYYLSDFDIDRS